MRLKDKVVVVTGGAGAGISPATTVFVPFRLAIAAHLNRRFGKYGVSKNHAAQNVPICGRLVDFSLLDNGNKS